MRLINSLSSNLYSSWSRLKTSVINYFEFDYDGIILGQKSSLLTDEDIVKL